MELKYPSVPVFMYHNVGVVNSNWIWSHLTCPWELFQQHLVWLKRFKISTITLKELYDYRKNNISLPSRSVVLSFDDGYLDNWVFAYPLLKKYGFKATIFVNPEFADPREIVRKTLEDVWAVNTGIETLNYAGFLSWEEMKIMESEGVIDIQSHSMSHTWYFNSDRIIDFHNPGNKKYPWLAWNKRPERKSYYLSENQEDFVPFGTPIYENGRSLGIRRYFECKRLNEYLADFTREKGHSFFNRQDWKNKLFEQAELFRAMNKLTDRYETLEEQKERYAYELGESKRIIEATLEKRVDFICWPGGAHNDLSIKTGFDVGYTAYSVSAHKNMGKNIYSEDPSVFYRVGAPNVQRKGRMYHLGGTAYVLRYFAFKGNIVARILQKCMRLGINMLIDLRIKKGGVDIHKYLF